MDSIRSMVAAGTLKPGDQLPSIRELAAQLRINPSSAVKSYNELRHAGIITQDHGRGTFISSKPGVATRNREELLEIELGALLSRTRDLGFEDEKVITALKRLKNKGGRT
jgi:GntR family transcriptional regulator